MSKLIVSFVTTNSEKEALHIAKTIVKEKLAACANIIQNVRSIYEWDGEIQDEKEYLLIIKTSKDKVDDLKSFIHNNHSYEVPEFIAFECTDALPDYFKWVMDVTD